MHVEQHAAVVVVVHDRRITDRIRATRDAGLNLPKRYLVRDHDGSFDARAAGALQVHGGRPNGKSGFDHTFAREIEIP